jgi:hypothetical protein
MSLEKDRQPLVGLELGEGLGRGGDAVAAFGALHGAGAIAQQAIGEIGGIVAPGGQDALASSANRQGLAAGDDLHPGDERGGWTRGRLGQQDLDRALERVLGVGGTQRDAAGGAAEVGLRDGEHGERPLAPPARKGRLLTRHIPVNPRAVRAALLPELDGFFRWSPSGASAASGRVPSGLR